jgi:hypothetical protein
MTGCWAPRCWGYCKPLLAAAQAFLAASRDEFASSAAFFGDVTLVEQLLRSRQDQLTVEHSLLTVTNPTLQDIDAGQDAGNRTLQKLDGRLGAIFDVLVDLGRRLDRVSASMLR